MGATHGWAEVDQERKREIIEGIRSGRATRGPVHAELDITDRCNVACYFCNQQDVRTSQQISFEHLAGLIDELASLGLRSVRMSGGGDPLAHREAGRVIDHLHARGVVLDNLTTNGALLSPEIARRLIEYRAREVLFSLNAVDRDDYQRMMQVKASTFDVVVGNITHLIRSRGPGSYPNVVVQFLIDRKNFSDLPRMYELGRSLQADRIAVGIVLNIPNQRIEPELLLHPADGEALRPYFEEILRRDRDSQLLQIDFPVPSWNAMLAELKERLSYPPAAPRFPTAEAFEERNGHCFFGWYSAAVRGNGDLYPCCLLMFPDYKPLGNALNGRFVDHWNGPQFSRMREEQREVFLAGDHAEFDAGRFQILRRQCVEPGLCYLKNVFFRGDEAFYRELGEALSSIRQRPRWRFRIRRSAASVSRRLRAATRWTPPSDSLLGAFARRLEPR
ncbi:MAG TPA: radical SAM protein [Thermoanaerobaculia bacterium]